VNEIVSWETVKVTFIGRYMLLVFWDIVIVARWLQIATIGGSYDSIVWIVTPILLWAHPLVEGGCEKRYWYNLGSSLFVGPYIGFW